jgi:hypothetical protein
MQDDIAYSQVPGIQITQAPALYHPEKKEDL